MSQVFWNWSHEACPSSHVDVWPLVCYFPTQTKHSRPHSALRVKGLTEDNVWLMPVSQLSWINSSICICTPDSGNWIHRKCCTELHKPWINTQLSLAFLLLYHCSASRRLSRAAELHTGMQQGHKENTGSLQRQKSPLASPQVCITHQWVLRTSLPKGHTATLWKPLFLSQAAEQGCREKAPQPHWHSVATLLMQQASHTHFGAVEQGAVDLIYWDKCKINFR